MSSWQEHQYEVLQTGDKSPSLRTLKATFFESMHHSGGAWAETLYIYGTALQVAKKAFAQRSIQIASVGLGLGYNELMSMAFSLRHELLVASLVSFESDPFLTKNLAAIMNAEELPSDLSYTYRQIFKFIGDEFKVSESELSKALQTQAWQTPGPLSKEWINRDDSAFNLVMYDAFSAKTSPELWDQDFLTNFLNICCARECVFATYACRGSLKRALELTGFQFVERPGFKGKRNSTLAVRGADVDISPYRQISEYIR